MDSTNSSTIGGGFWPKGTPDQYMFNSGLQLAGIIGADGGAWAGDTVGAFFFDPKGTTEHGEPVNVRIPGSPNQGLYNSSRADDLAEWPDAACVPNGDDTANFFDPALQTDVGNVANPNCRKFASQQDVWFLSWEGNPALNAGRKHPLGIMVETRGMGWNFPVGNEDILYFIYTFYNITSTNAADYAAVRPAMQPVLMERAQKFQTWNSSASAWRAGGRLHHQQPVRRLLGGHGRRRGRRPTTPREPAVRAGLHVRPRLRGAQGWTVRSDDLQGRRSSPAPASSGVKYLEPARPAPVSSICSATRSTSGAFDDAQNTIQLYRYLSGNIHGGGRRVVHLQPDARTTSAS